MTGKTEKDIHAEEKKRKRKRERNTDADKAIRMNIEWDNGICVGKKKEEKTCTNRKTKGKDKSLVRRPESKNEIDLEGQSGGEANHGEIYIVSSRDENCFKGMKKWITQFHKIRPGMEVLQQQIDDFITAHEKKLEQERKEREACAADGGWTFVVHHKGRKKTTDSGSGIVVGSVAQAAVENKMAKKKCREVGLGLASYRFQKKGSSEKW